MSSLPSHHAQAILEINRDIVETRKQIDRLEREMQGLVDRQVILFQILRQLEDEKRGILDEGYHPRRWIGE
jgi:hypothetical protein